jgi:hypothetical protein
MRWGAGDGSKSAGRGSWRCHKPGSRAQGLSFEGFGVIVICYGAEVRERKTAKHTAAACQVACVASSTLE